MISNDLINKVRIILMENDVSIETTISIVKLLIAEKFKSLADLNNSYVIALNDIKSTLENDKTDDFECVEKIVTIFENLDIAVEYRHDFWWYVEGSPNLSNGKPHRFFCVPKKYYLCYNVHIGTRINFQ